MLSKRKVAQTGFKDHLSMKSRRFWLAVDNRGNTELHLACRTGEKNEILNLAITKPNLFKRVYTNRDGESALDVAVMYGNNDATEALFEVMPHIFEQLSYNTRDESPLHLAALSNDSHVVRTLHKAAPHFFATTNRDVSKRTPLQWAVENKNVAMVRNLASLSPALFSSELLDALNNPAIFYAISSGEPELVAPFIDNDFVNSEYVFIYLLKAFNRHKVDLAKQPKWLAITQILVDGARRNHDLNIVLTLEDQDQHIQSNRNLITHFQASPYIALLMAFGVQFKVKCDGKIFSSTQFEQLSTLFLDMLANPENASSHRDRVLELLKQKDYRSLFELLVQLVRFPEHIKNQILSYTYTGMAEAFLTAIAANGFFIKYPDEKTLDEARANYYTDQILPLIVKDELRASLEEQLRPAIYGAFITCLEVHQQHCQFVGMPKELLDLLVEKGIDLMSVVTSKDVYIPFEEAFNEVFNIWIREKQDKMEAPNKLSLRELCITISREALVNFVPEEDFSEQERNLLKKNLNSWLYEKLSSTAIEICRNKEEELKSAVLTTLYYQTLVDALAVKTSLLKAIEETINPTLAAPATTKAARGRGRAKYIRDAAPDGEAELVGVNSSSQIDAAFDRALDDLITANDNVDEHHRASESNYEIDGDGHDEDDDLDFGSLFTTRTVFAARGDGSAGRTG